LLPDGEGGGEWTHVLTVRPQENVTISSTEVCSCWGLLWVQS